MKSFLLRTGSALVFGPLTLLCLFAGQGPAVIFLTILLMISLAEAFVLIRKKRYPMSKTFIVLVFMYLFGGFLAPIYLAYCDPKMIILLFLLVWTCDSGAYLVGRVVGGAKIVPKISPNKTWSGALGGFFLTVAVGSLLIYYTRDSEALGIYACFHVLTDLSYTTFMMLLSIYVGIFTQLGDWLQSWLKRLLNVKDSGSLIPGHGGILDRLDGFIMVGFFLFVFLGFLKIYD